MDIRHEKARRSRPKQTSPKKKMKASIIITYSQFQNLIMKDGLNDFFQHIFEKGN
jgi:hypothetical protein